jgi:4-hydroxy-tetrahydrodipicolinate reductase
VAHARLCADAGVPMVVGSTGFTAEAKEQMAAAAKKIPLVMSPNMSVGVNLVIELAATLAKRLGEDFDVEVMETHHRMKKDAPSGTAMRLADELAKALGREHSDIRTSRVGQVGERPRKEIGVQALRGGDVVGEHTVFFFGDGERVELTHRATSREQFGRGALRAAGWIGGKAPGLYDMTHVLGAK